MKFKILFLILTLIFVLGCDQNAVVKSKNLSAEAKKDGVDFEAHIILGEFNGVELDNDMTNILLTVDNHQEDLTSYDFSQSLLDGQKAVDFKVISQNMGGHHVEVLLSYPADDIFERLKVTGAPVGDVELNFIKSDEE